MVIFQFAVLFQDVAGNEQKQVFCVFWKSTADRPMQCIENDNR